MQVCFVCFLRASISDTLRTGTIKKYFPEKASLISFVYLFFSPHLRVGFLAFSSASAAFSSSVVSVLLALSYLSHSHLSHTYLSLCALTCVSRGPGSACSSRAEGARAGRLGSQACGYWDLHPRGVSRHVISGHVMLRCYAVSCRAMSHHVMSCHVISRHVMPCYVSRRVLSCRVAACRVAKSGCNTLTQLPLSRFRCGVIQSFCFYF